MRALLDRARRNRYVATALVANGGIWLCVLAALALTGASYTSEWALILPGNDMDAHVNVSDIGQAYAISRSAYDAKSLDPRVNYKTILVSPTVLSAAAHALNQTVEAFGRPKIKLIDQSSVIELAITGSSPEQAQAKAVALSDAFERRIAALRADEGLQRDKGAEEAIRSTRGKLDEAQRNLVDFKVGARIVSAKQLEETVLRATTLQQRRLDLESQLARSRGFVAKLGGSIGVSPEAAGQIISLQADALFMQFFQKYALAAAELAEYRYKWGPRHPQVVSAEKRMDATLTALSVRAETVLDAPITKARLQRLTIAMSDQAQEPLFRELVSNHVQALAQQNELSAVDQQLTQMKRELDRLAQEYSELDDLERRVKFAEAVFNSAIGKIDVGKSNIFSSYPLVQQLMRPTLPQTRDRRRLLFALLGGLASSVFVSTGLTLAWLRRKTP